MTTRPSCLPPVLQAGRWYISGGPSGGGQEFPIYAPSNNDAGAPVVVNIAGAGGAGTPEFNKTPRPSWAVMIAQGGNHKVRTPAYLRELLRYLRTVTARSNNKILLFGFSRGGAWIVDCALSYAEYFDTAIACAPYPWTKGTWENDQEARVLMQVRIPLLLVHYDRDESCNAQKYPKWYANFAIGMVAEVGEAFGQRQPPAVLADAPLDGDARRTVDCGMPLQGRIG